MKRNQLDFKTDYPVQKRNIFQLLMVIKNKEKMQNSDFLKI